MAVTFAPAAPFDAEVLLPLDLVKLQLKLSDDDARWPLAKAQRLASLIWVEKRSGFSLQRRAWVATFTDLADGVRLPMGPVSAVTAFSYRHSAGLAQVWPSTSYRLDGNEVVTATGLACRTAFAGMAVTIQYSAGFPSLADDAPHLQMAALLLLLHLWSGGSLDDVPATVTMLCDLDRVPVIG